MGNARKTAKKAISMLLSLVLVLSLFPATALEADEKEDDLVVSKTAELQADGTYTLTLEAYATGTVTTSRTQVPTDVVLVLDTSGSMGDTLETVDEPFFAKNDVTTYGGALLYWNNLWVKDTEDGEYYQVSVELGWENTLTYTKDGVKITIGKGGALSTVEPAAGSTLETSGDHVQFYSQTRDISALAALQAAATGFIRATAEKNDAIKDTNKQHKISIVEFASSANEIYSLQPVTSDNVESAVGKIADLRANGATGADYAMDQAKNVLLYDQSTGTVLDDGRNKVVVFFTDGEPNHNNGFDDTVAADTVNAAEELKSAGVTIYTIGLFKEADASDTQGNFNKYMHAVSSNYPKATATDDRGFNVTWGDVDDSDRGYYKVADDAASLVNIFEEISQDVGSTTVELDANAVLKDIMNDGKFALPKEGYDENSIVVKTADYNGMIDGKRQWKPYEVFTDGTVKVIDDTVSVSGFSYKDNYVATENGKNRGQKLMVTIPGVEAQPGAVTGKQVFTNDPYSGIYDENDVPTGYFESPSVVIEQVSYVLDYAAPVTVDSTDWGFQEICHVAEDMSAIETAQLDMEEKLDYGTVNVTVTPDGASASVTYKPTADTWNGVDSIYVFGRDDTGELMWKRVNFVPANNVYYENNFTVDSGVSGITQTLDDMPY